MKQISTGAGLVALSVGMVATAFLATHRGGSEAFAQGTGADRRIVSNGVYASNGAGLPRWAYRVWSDNVVEITFVAIAEGVSQSRQYLMRLTKNGWTSAWQVVDDGTSAFVSADVDHSRQVNAGDISAVLLEWGNGTEEAPPPPVDCNINAPR